MGGIECKGWDRTLIGAVIGVIDRGLVVGLLGGIALGLVRGRCGLRCGSGIVVSWSA